MHTNKVMQQALDAFDLHAKQYPHMVKGYTSDAADALRAALAQPEGEPFGFVRESYTDARLATSHISKTKYGDYSIEVFTHPAPFTPITDKDVTDEMLDAMEVSKDRGYRAIAVAAVNAWGAKK